MMNMEVFITHIRDINEISDEKEQEVGTNMTFYPILIRVVCRPLLFHALI